MLLSTLLQAYTIEELMPAINEMFPGTKKYYAQFKQAFDLMMNMHPVASHKTIRYKLIKVPKSDETYMGAEDNCFTSSWESTLGRDLVKDHGVTLTDTEMVANSFVNMCLQGKCPAAFKRAQQELLADY